MEKFGIDHYVPILKGKQGEFNALGDLTLEQKKKITPLIELVNLPFDPDDEERTPADIEKHFNKFMPSIEEGWGKNAEFFVDFYALLPDQRTTDGSHPLIYVFNDARQKELKPIPVTGLRRGAEYDEAVKHTIAEDKRGVCLRLESDDLDDVNITAILDDFVKELSLEPSDVDLLIDFNEIREHQEQIIAIAAKFFLRGLPHLDEWRTLSLAGTAFPESLSANDGFHKNSAISTPRLEWQLWKSIALADGVVKRKPTFSDYGIAHPKIADFDPRMMTMSANIRYTTENDWLILKGSSLFRGDKGFEQYHELAQQLVERREFSGKDFSEGDKRIFECAHKKSGTGNASTWRRIGTNHHLVFVSDQITNLARA